MPLLKEDINDYTDKQQLTYTVVVGSALGGCSGMIFIGNSDLSGLLVKMAIGAVVGGILFFLLGSLLLKKGINSKN